MQSPPVSLQVYIQWSHLLSFFQNKTQTLILPFFVISSLLSLPVMFSHWRASGPRVYTPHPLCRDYQHTTLYAPGILTLMTLLRSHIFFSSQTLCLGLIPFISSFSNFLLLSLIVLASSYYNFPVTLLFIHLLLNYELHKIRN